MTTAQHQVSQQSETDEMRGFLLVVRRALLLIVDYIERRYGLNRRH